MHVVLISNCEKRAIRRSRAILDSYALRHGDRVWMTPITLSGLSELHSMLRRTSTRQTSVACFRNEGRSRMKILWIVGNRRGFGPWGVFPVATRARVGTPQTAQWWRMAALLAGAGGNTHDLGKFLETFQKKLTRSGPVADPVRHEWMSFLVVRAMMKGESWDDAWSRLIGNARRYEDIDPFDGALDTARDALLYIIATHHRLPENDNGGKRAGGSTVLCDQGYVRDRGYRPDPGRHAPSAVTLATIRRKLDKIGAAEPHEQLYWRAVATVARMALILADHSVSSIEEDRIFADGPCAYANTGFRGADRTTRVLKQELNQHLLQVGALAGDLVFRMLSLSPPALSPETVERVMERSSDRAFAWQDTAARALTESRRMQRVPHLVLNMAGTGSGKTRGNLKMLCALNTQDDDEVRIAVALNLRTLTLQTADAYRKQVDIGEEELSCVIGDRLAQVLHEQSRPAHEDEDGNDPENEAEVALPFHYATAPSWLEPFIRKSPSTASVIGAPLLVSTVDYLVAAGEPHRQAHHAMAALRLMTSDLVLDEIDSYDPKPLLAVLRMVTLSALFGRHVVSSSATLSRPVASLLWRAYHLGASMRAQLTGDGRFRTALVHDLAPPRVLESETVEQFTRDYDGHVAGMLATLKGQRYREPYLQKVEDSSLDSWNAALLTAVNALHREHAWEDPVTGKRLSIGLVRLANVTPAIRTAMFLAQKLPQARVACYHANHLALQRAHIERRLDDLLVRKDGDRHITDDPEIRALLDDPARQDLMLIVVASPVEEIGRDHDFDWAVIDPSSVQSIVQTAGRVNRHRLVEISSPNVAIMQINRRCAQSADPGKRAFYWPGYETGKKPYPSHDLGDLLDWNALRGLRNIDARMRFGTHEFARLDDAAIRQTTEGEFSRTISDNQWMSVDTYKRTSLREQSRTLEIVLKEKPPLQEEDLLWIRESWVTGKMRDITVSAIDRAANDWLVLEDSEIREQARDLRERHGIPEEDALRTSVHPPDDKPPNNWLRHHRSFGFFAESGS